MNRPLADKRPIGPINEAVDYGKDVLGITGTPMPNRDKNPVILVYRMDGDRPFQSRDFKNAVQQEVDQLVDEDFGGARVTYKKSGPSSKADFNDPAVVIEIPGESLPINDSSVHRVEQSIIRIAGNADMETTISEIFIEQE